MKDQNYFYTIIVFPAEEGGFLAEIPALPGCMSQGETEKEAFQNAQEAMEGYLECLIELNKKIPTEESHPQMKTAKFHLQNNVPKVSFA